jgi:hypothetical protein
MTNRTYPQGVPCWVDTEQPDVEAATAAQEYCHRQRRLRRAGATPAAQARWCTVAGTVVFRGCRRRPGSG